MCSKGKHFFLSAVYISPAMFNLMKSLPDVVVEDGEVLGPIQMGLNKPIHFTDFECSVRDIINITAVAVIDAIVEEKKQK